MAFSRALTIMDMAANQSKIPCDERRQESTKTKRNTESKVVLVASGMDDEMDSLAINLAIDAISVFRNEKIKIAKYIVSKFEAKYGAPWHCIVSDGHMRFYVRYDADDHIFFAVNGITIFLFRLHTSKSRPLINRLHRRLSDALMKVESPRDDVHVISTGMQLPMQHYALRLTDDAIVEFPNEKMIIAHFITTRFAAQYGGNWHCVVSDGRLGYEVRHHSEDHIFFSVGSLTILLFREEDVKNATIKSPRLKPRKLSTSMQLPTKIISSCMDMEMQQFAVTVAAQGIRMKFPDEKTQIAQLLMQRFDERFGAPWHCIVGDQPLDFYARYDQQNYIYFIVEPLTILLFKHQKEKLLSEEISEETKGAALVEGEGDANREVRVIDSGLDKSMDEKATLFAREAVNRFPNERMLSAHYIMRRLESQYGPPWHCVVSEGSLGYSTHQADSCYCYLQIDSFYVFLFQHDTSFDQE